MKQSCRDHSRPGGGDGGPGGCGCHLVMQHGRGAGCVQSRSSRTRVDIRVLAGSSRLVKAAGFAERQGLPPADQPLRAPDPAGRALTAWQGRPWEARRERAAGRGRRCKNRAPALFRGQPDLELGL